jgi:cyclophilin family peptidyl-prolyl cis-trans isomerase
MHNPWVLTAFMAVIALGTIAGTFLATAGYANRSTAGNTPANRSDVVDQTQLTATATATPTATAGAVRAYASPPPMTVDPNKQYTATVKTNKGDFTIQLYPKDAPATVNSFIFLAQNHYFDGLSFDRVVPGFVVQGGDPNGDATGGPGYKLPDEINSHKNDTGTVAMANAGPGTDGSTFYIDLAPQPNLDALHQYTVFGQVTSGLDVVNAIGQTPRDPANRAAPAVKIDSITISPQ